MRGRSIIDVIGRGGFGVVRGFIIRLWRAFWNFQEREEGTIARRRSAITILRMENIMPGK